MLWCKWPTFSPDILKDPIMNENVWKLPQAVKILHGAVHVITNNKKAIVGIAGAASIAAFFILKGKRDDTPLFERTLLQMNTVEEHAVQQMSKLQHTQDFNKAALILQDSTLPVWQNFQQQVSTTKKLKLDKELERKRQLLVEYADLRVDQSKLLYKAFSENTNSYDQALGKVYDRINSILDELQH